MICTAAFAPRQQTGREENVTALWNTSALRSLALQRGVEHIREVDCGPASALPDLLAATEPICHDDGFGRRPSHRRQQHPLAYRLRDRELIALESEWPGHSAAARIGTVQLH